MGRLPPKNYTDDFEPSSAIQMRPIALVRSPHRERFGTPRQAVVPADPAERPDERAYIELLPHIPASSLKDLEGFDYVWLISWMHLNQGYKPQIMPPRGPRVRRGVFATRSPHRPNPLALSAARLLGVEDRRIYLERVDLLDGTQILDLKPYVPYADAFADASAGWLDEFDGNRATR